MGFYHRVEVLTDEQRAQEWEKRQPGCTVRRNLGPYYMCCRFRRSRWSLRTVCLSFFVLRLFFGARCPHFE